MTATRLDLEQRPILVFWETTRACLLACRHCRASAVSEPLPGELSAGEAEQFLESLTGFGRPLPVLVLTGGDVLMRSDLLTLVGRARGLGLPVAVSPSVTELLRAPVLMKLRRSGVRVASVSLDGATAQTHEALRGIEGHFKATLDAARLLRRMGFVTQVNTVVRPESVEELPDIAALVAEIKAAIWEVFFLVRTGRGAQLSELSPAENEDVCHFLVEASRYGFIVRTVEAPFFRRVVTRRADGGAGKTGPLYKQLTERLHTVLGPPRTDSRAQTKGTRDGKGIVFVSHDGSVYPAGFLPISVGNVRERSLVDIYRESPLLRDIRAARFGGRCGACEFADLCGGSRARAYAATGDPLGEDPACAYIPASLRAGVRRTAERRTIGRVDGSPPSFASAAGLFVFDDDLRILCWNDRAEELTGVPARDAVGRRCWEVIAGRDDRGVIICHKGCSRARLAREGHCLPATVLHARTNAGRRRVRLETISARTNGSTLFVHLMHDAPQSAEEASPPREPAPHLTPRQAEILSLLAQGKPCKGIARELEVSEATVRNHIQRLFRSLGVHSQLEAIARAREHCLI